MLITVDGQNTKLYLGKDKVELFANQRTIEVKSGQADILLDGQRGDVTIKGTNVKIEATQSIKLTAQPGDRDRQPGPGEGQRGDGGGQGNGEDRPRRHRRHVRRRHTGEDQLMSDTRRTSSVRA